MQEFAKLVLDKECGHYHPKGGSYASSIGIGFLGIFLAEDVGSNIRGFKDWALNDAETITGSNATALEKENGFVVIFDGTESMTDEIRANGLKIPLAQFIQLLDDWKEEVCEKKPKEVIIKYENDLFFIETKN